MFVYLQTTNAYTYRIINVHNIDAKTLKNAIAERKQKDV